MREILHAPGFLGTHGNFAADITLLLSLLVALIFTAGFVAARRKKYRLHGRIQTAGALLNLMLVGWMMVLPFRDFVIREAAPPRPRPDYFYGITTLHALVGAAALLFGLFVVLRANGLMIRRLRFNNYLPYMRVAYGLYMTASLLGILVYVTWFIVVPNPPEFGRALMAGVL